ncbi:MAG: hypothetical protein KBT76_14650 [Sulfitobacter litoralis]|nr:hypothetical protein [Sulfitobacter litoralis]
MAQLYAFIDGDGELLISDTTMLDRASNDGVVFNLETRKFDVISWYDGTEPHVHSSHDMPADAIASMNELT